MKGRVNGWRFTFFQEIWNLFLTKRAHCCNVAIVSEERKDIVCEHICVCVGAGGVLATRPDGACPPPFMVSLRPSDVYLRIFQSLNNPSLQLWRFFVGEQHRDERKDIVKIVSEAGV